MLPKFEEKKKPKNENTMLPYMFGIPDQIPKFSPKFHRRFNDCLLILFVGSMEQTLFKSAIFFSSIADILLNYKSGEVSGQVTPLELGYDLHALPAPWFINAFMGVGVGLCCITCIGHVAAEAINGCCLCFYSLLTTILILLEAAFVTFVAIDHHWEKDLPPEPTGELDNLRSFIETNVDVCKWVGIGVVIIQVLSLLLSIVLRAMVSASRVDPELEEDYEVGNRIRDPLLQPQLGQTSGPYNKGDNKGSHSDIWSSRMREKYGLGGGGGGSGEAHTSVQLECIQ